MVYRNGTYIAFDANGEVSPIGSDIRYYRLVTMWGLDKKSDFLFSDSHKKTYAVRDNSTIITLKNRLNQRLAASKNVLIILSNETNYDRGLLNYEIERAVDYYKLPLIIAYTGLSGQLRLGSTSIQNRWPRALRVRINDGTARCLHVPFKKLPIGDAIVNYTVHSNNLTGPKHTYTDEVLRRWGLI